MADRCACFQGCSTGAISSHFRIRWSKAMAAIWLPHKRLRGVPAETWPMEAMACGSQSPASGANNGQRPAGEVANPDPPGLQAAKRSNLERQSALAFSMRSRYSSCRILNRRKYVRTGQQESLLAAWSRVRACCALSDVCSARLVYGGGTRSRGRCVALSMRAVT